MSNFVLERRHVFWQIAAMPAPEPGGNFNGGRMANTSLKAKAKWLVAYYEGTRRSDDCEPSWVHPEFAAAYRLDQTGKADAEDRLAIFSIYYCHHDQKDGPHECPIFGGRYIQDGVKVGTTTWIFLGRKACHPLVQGKWTIISREFRGDGDWPRRKWYMAYLNDRAMGASAATGEEIGPCGSLDEVTFYIEEAMEAGVGV